MRGQEDCLAQSLDCFSNLQDLIGIQTGGRFVHDQDLRVEVDRAGNGDPLPLVGRGEQAQKIVDHLVDRETPGAVTLIGGGQGQRTGALLEEVARQCRQQGMRDLRGTFRGTAGQPLKGFNDLLRDLVGVQSGDTAAEQIRETASVQLEQWLGEDAAAIAYFLDELTGESSPEKSSEQMRSFWWFKLVSAVAREMPLLITLDDYEEADPDSQKMLRGLLERCRQESIPASYALATDREEDQKTPVPEGWDGGASHRSYALFISWRWQTLETIFSDGEFKIVQCGITLFGSSCSSD